MCSPIRPALADCRHGQGQLFGREGCFIDIFMFTFVTF